MDAREKLRRYLEQRREMGESELVLDTMTVEDALRIVGGAAARGASADVEAPATPVARNADAPPATADWRAALRETGAAPELLSKRPVTRTEPVASANNQPSNEPPAAMPPRKPIS